MMVERWVGSGPLWLGLALCFAGAAVSWQLALNAALGATQDRAAATDPTRDIVVASDGAAMVLVPAGTYRPFFKERSGGRAEPVAAFLMDAAPVTRGQYLEFVRRAPGYRKSRIARLFAEPGYLADWPGDLSAGPDLEAPVTHVSWFAAKAYCESVGKRLPTTAEWERTAGKTTAAPAAGAARRQSPFRFAMGRAEPEARGVHGFGRIWEWTSDFNSMLVAGQAGDENGAAAAASAFCGEGIRATDPSDYAAYLRYSFRASLKADYALKTLGFRCAKQP